MELLAPAGNKENFYAALNSGADAIYVGGKSFSARAYASNFSIEELEECVREAHLRNVLVYVAVNTLLFENELERCIKECEEYIRIGVDAFIVQDLGLVSILRRMYPSFPLHASTQMNVNTLDQALKLKELGITRIVLARECSFYTIKEIKEKTNLEIEIFIHGALCVSSSGQCLMSSFIGDRSGNRGRCAQPCRMEGKLLSNSTSKKGYILSTKELCTLEYIDKFKEIGIDSLKIEGRMKGIEYIYTTVSYYRKKIDGEKFSIDEAINDLKTSYNRKFTKGYMFDESQTKVLNQKSSSHQGIILGKVSKITNNSFFLVLKNDLNLHDGLKVYGKEDGFLLTHFKLKGNDVREAKKGDYVEIITKIKNIKVDDLILKTKSSKLEKAANEVIKINKKVDITGYFTSSKENGMSLTLFDNDISYTAYIDTKLEKSVNAFVSKKDIFERLKKSDKYPFNLKYVDFDIEPGLFYPNGLLNELRRNAYLGLYEEKLNRNEIHNKVDVIPYNLNDVKQSNKPICLVYKEEQLKVCLNYDFEYIFINSLSLYNKYKDLDNRIRYEKKRLPNSSENINDSLTNYISKNKGIISPYGNVTNSESLALYLSHNHNGVVLSYEVSYKNALNLKEEFIKKYKVNPPLYYPLYGHIELMLLKSCPIASFNNKENIHCGLCKKEQYYYEDRIGVKYPLVSDENCVTKVLSDKPLYLLDKKDLIEKDFASYLVFTIENEILTKNILDNYFFDKDVEIDGFIGHFVSSPE